jgi:5-hydroxyisourate hydrolase
MITTHVLDTTTGRPAAGIAIALEVRDPAGAWRAVGRGSTDNDGRLRTLTPSEEPIVPGTYRLLFDVDGYFRSTGVVAFYPRVTIEFITVDGESHYHVPLLLSPFGYSTYRGS